MTERYKICKGTPLKITHLKINENKITGESSWSFGVPMNTKQGAFEFVRIKVNGKCEYREGEKVRISEIISYHSVPLYGLNGGRRIYRTLECEVEPYKRVESDEEEDDYE